MDYLKIKKTGIYGYKYDPEKNKYIGKKIKKNRILTALRSTCKIDKDVILLDIIKHVEYYKDLKKFIAFYCWCSSIDDLNLDAFTPVDETKKSDIKYLEISIMATDFKWKKKHDYGAYTDFIGIGVNEQGEEERYSVSYCPVSEIAYLPVVLNNKFKIWSEYDAKKQEVIFESTINLNLLNILDAIYWDISFVGGPKQKREFLGELKDRLDELDDEE